MSLPADFIGPRRPWHVAAGVTPSQMAENLAKGRAPQSASDRARSVWWDTFNGLRAAGFSQDRVFTREDGSTWTVNAGAVAGAEVRAAMRKIGVVSHAQVPQRKPSQIPVGGELVYVRTTDKEGCEVGKIARVGDADDSTPISALFESFDVRDSAEGVPAGSTFDPAREEELKRFQTAERLFAECVEAETGNGVSVEEWMARKLDREEMRRQSHVIANKLECGGTAAYRSDEYQLLIWHVFSKEFESVPAFRRLCFIPHVAAMVRAQKLAALEFFLDRHPHCRFWTFSSGRRVPLSGLRQRIEQLHKRLNALNKELRRLYGCELIFRATELGTVETAETAGRAKARRAARTAHKLAVDKARAEGRAVPTWTRAKENQFSDEAGGIERDEQTGELMFHPHAHCVFYSHGRILPKEEWSQMLRFVWDHWGDHWDDGKIIGDAREAVKYCLKPGDVAALSPADLCALEKAVHGLRLVTPMGVLKNEIRARKEAGETLRRVRTPEGMVWNVVPDHNKQLSRTEEEREELREFTRAANFDRLDVALGRGHTGNLPRKSTGPLCRVVARLAPAAGVTPIKEPRVMVMATKGAADPAAVMRHPLTVKLWNQGIQAWEAGRAIRVHTGTPTGEQRSFTLLADTDERFAPVTEAVWEASKPLTLTPSGFAFSAN